MSVESGTNWMRSISLLEDPDAYNRTFWKHVLSFVSVQDIWYTDIIKHTLTKVLNKAQAKREKIGTKQKILYKRKLHTRTNDNNNKQKKHFWFSSVLFYPCKLEGCFVYIHEDGCRDGGGTGSFVAGHLKRTWLRRTKAPRTKQRSTLGNTDADEEVQMKTAVQRHAVAFDCCIYAIHLHYSILPFMVSLQSFTYLNIKRTKKTSVAIITYILQVLVELELPVFVYCGCTVFLCEIKSLH